MGCGFGYCIATELTENTEKNQIVKNKGQNWVAVLGYGIATEDTESTEGSTILNFEFLVLNFFRRRIEFWFDGNCGASPARYSFEFLVLSF